MERIICKLYVIVGAIGRLQLRVTCDLPTLPGTLRIPDMERA